jgi:NADH-quinone oxidoreductase subunit N
MLLLMFSLAGVPPTVGFYAKLAVLQGAMDAGFLGLAIVAVLLSLIGAFYYLRIVRLMYFDEPVDGTPIVAPVGARLLLSLNGLAALVVGIVPGWLMTICQQAMQASL